jgi:SAM-dependent methyltransferase
VFFSDERHRVLLPRYLLLVFANGALAYAGIEALTRRYGIGVLAAKVLVETIIFLANFVIQRDFVFTRRSAPAATNWDLYYRSVPITAQLTRRYTGSVLISTLKRYAAPAGLKTIVEIGGANSCFMARILDGLRPDGYHVIDLNQFGLDLLRERFPDSANVLLHQADVLKLPDLGLEADVVFSVGLIEHFDRPQTRQAIDAHFELLRPGGIAILSYPTPTWLYQMARTACETFGLWHFPDERPLKRKEVFDSVTRWGEVVFEKTLWPLVFTQHLMVIRKNESMR